MPRYDIDFIPNSSAEIRGINVLWALREDNYRGPTITNMRMLLNMNSTYDSFRRDLGTRQAPVLIYAFFLCRLSDEFGRLKEKWKSETAHLSSVTDIVMHPSYQRIIGMGQDAIPLILAELDKEPDLWFWALGTITGYNPVSQEQRGQIREMTESWLSWGREQGYLNEQSGA